MTEAERPGLASFSDVDATQQASALIAALDEQASLPAVQRVRTTAAELLRPRVGDRLLDVGCGTGEVVRALSGLVGAHGSVVDCWASHAANGWSGRRLPGLFIDAGLRELVVVTETITTADQPRPTGPPFATMAATAERAGALSPEDARAWLTQLADAAERGQFLWAVTMFAVAGTRPPVSSASRATAPDHQTHNPRKHP